MKNNESNHLECDQQKSREKILNLLQIHPDYSANKLSEEIGITPKAIEKQLAKLKADDRIRRTGPDKGGGWEVIDGSPPVGDGGDGIADQVGNDGRGLG